MKSPDFIKQLEQTVALKMKAIDVVIKDLVEPLSDIGNPEQLIKKPYEQWSPQDLQMLGKIYGQGNDTPLARTIFNKEYDRVRQLESEVEL